MATKEQASGDSENRRHARKAIELKVEYKRMNAFFADFTRNISHGGTFIKTHKPLPIGTEFVFKLQVPSLDEPLSINGQVRWLVEPGEETEEDQDAGMGIRFVYQEPGERAAIEALVEGLMVDSLGRLLTSKLMSRNGEDSEDEEAGLPSGESE